MQLPLQILTRECECGCSGNGELASSKTCDVTRPVHGWCWWNIPIPVRVYLYICTSFHLSMKKSQSVVTPTIKWPVGELEWVEMLPSRISIFGSRFGESQHSYFINKCVMVKVGSHAPSRDQRGKWHFGLVTDLTATQVRVHIDGWSRQYDRWIDVSQPNYTDVRSTFAFLPNCLVMLNWIVHCMSSCCRT